MLRLIRTISVASVVIITASVEVYRKQLLCAGASYNNRCGYVTGLGIFVFILSILCPLISVYLLPNIIRNYVVSTSIELMKHRPTIVTVITATRSDRLVKLFKTIMAFSHMVDQIRHVTRTVRDIGSANGSLNVSRRGSAEIPRESAENGGNIGSLRDIATSFRASTEQARLRRSLETLHIRRSLEQTHVVRASMEQVCVCMCVCMGFGGMMFVGCLDTGIRFCVYAFMRRAYFLQPIVVWCLPS
jgi:hypothetical protein